MTLGLRAKPAMTVAKPTMPMAEPATTVVEPATTVAKTAATVIEPAAPLRGGVRSEEKLWIRPGALRLVTWDLTHNNEPDSILGRDFLPPVLRAQNRGSWSTPQSTQ